MGCSRRRWKRVVVLAVALIAIVYYACEPWICILGMSLADRHGPGRVEESIVNCLARRRGASLPAILWGVRHHFPYVPPASTIFILSLQRIGEPARQALIHAADEERDPAIRDRYIYLLQESLGDFRRAPVWMDDLLMRPGSKIGNYFSESLSDLVGAAGSKFPFATVPLFYNMDGDYNLAFFVWYNRHTAPRGPLPPLHLQPDQVAQ